MTMLRFNVVVNHGGIMQKPMWEKTVERLLEAVAIGVLLAAALNIDSLSAVLFR